MLLEYFSHTGFQAEVLLSDFLRDVNLIKQFILNNLRHQSMDGFYGSFTAGKKKTHHIMSQELRTISNMQIPPPPFPSLHANNDFWSYSYSAKYTVPIYSLLFIVYYSDF